MSLTADQAKVLLNASFLPSLNAEHPVTKRVIAAIPADKIDYRPDDIVKSAIDLAWHIVTAENRFLEAVINGVFDLTPVPRPDAMRTGDAVNAWYSERFAKNIDRIKQLSGEQLVKSIDFRGLFQFPAVIYASLGLNHSIHHRGQLSMYLRPMGAKVPSIYGESYDARIAREAAQATKA
ncbi:MAG: DinB family protein [Acidobacteria bacterium]|nr:DinB family protein [Acidobacteriota bacterium]